MTAEDRPDLLDRPERRIDGDAKTTGAALYTADVDVPGTLQAAFVRSPYPHARIALGGAGPVPLRARDAERSLLGRRVDDAAVREAAALAAAATDPMSDLRGSAEYKRAMAGVWTARALREVA